MSTFYLLLFHMRQAIAIEAYISVVMLSPNLCSVLVFTLFKHPPLLHLASAGGGGCGLLASCHYDEDMEETKGYYAEVICHYFYCRSGLVSGGVLLLCW